MSLDPELHAAASRWIADDLPDGPAGSPADSNSTGDRAELSRVLADARAGKPGAAADLAARMAGPLRFGTAGLRGPLRAGPAGMNRAVVLRTSAGLAGWLRARGRGGPVVVGRDTRHRSERFAADAAGVFAAAGFDTVLLPRPLPTPVLAFAARRLDAAAGVQITASHNPAGDNGYKVYVDGGVQLAPPADTEIEAAIAAAPPARAVPVGTGVRTGGDDLVEAYLRRVGGLVPARDRGPRVVATALHGVGAEVATEAWRRAGVTDVEWVAEQAAPDPDFPTVAFPNPEEPGATEALLALAAGRDADLAVALDPDADRCALGFRDPRSGWRMLTGDETGVLLGTYLLDGLDRSAHPDPLVATSEVSSGLLGAVAQRRGARWVVTPTGFKWLMRAGAGLVYAYEEALGYCVDPDAVRDKDGISAALLACDLLAAAADPGAEIAARLDALAVQHGVHHTEQVSVRTADLAASRATMAALRSRPPAALASHPVTVRDHLRRAERPDDLLALYGAGFRVLVRPSGTEPKIKAYLEVVEPVPGPAELPAARRAAAHRAGAVRSATLDLLREPCQAPDRCPPC